MVYRDVISQFLTQNQFWLDPQSPQKIYIIYILKVKSTFRLCAHISRFIFNSLSHLWHDYKKLYIVLNDLSKVCFLTVTLLRFKF